jgi:hypothetical protein
MVIIFNIHVNRIKIFYLFLHMDAIIQNRGALLMNEDINNTTGGTNPLQEVLEQADKIILDPMLSTGGIGKTASVKTSDMIVLKR